MIEIHRNIKVELAKADQLMTRSYKKWKQTDIMDVAEAYLSLRVLYNQLKEEGLIKYRGYQRRKEKVKEWKEPKDAWLFDEVPKQFKEKLTNV